MRKMALQTEYLIILDISLITGVSDFLVILQERELWDMIPLGTCTRRLVPYPTTYTFIAFTVTHS